MIVSVCVISYNQSKYIGQCLNSIIDQKAEAILEIIVSDDASEDETVSIAEGILSKSGFAYKINARKKNGGFQENFSDAFNLCSGDYIAICEADDFWVDKFKLDKQLSVLLSDRSASMCFTACQLVSDSGNEISFYKPYEKKLGLCLDDVISGGGGLCPTCTIFATSSLLKSLPNWIFKMPVLDYPIQVYLASKGKVYYLPEVTGAYRMASQGSWSSQNSENKKYIERYFKSIKMYWAVDSFLKGKKRNFLNRAFFKSSVLFYFRRPPVKVYTKALVEDFMRYGWKSMILMISPVVSFVYPLLPKRIARILSRF